MRLRLNDPWIPLLWAVLGVAALLMGGRLPWSIFFLFTALLLLSGGWTAYAARHVEIELQRGRLRSTAGEQLEVSLAVENAGWLPVPHLALEDVSEAPIGLLSEPLLLSMPVSASATYRLRTRPLRRGRYALGPLEARVRDPFGLFEKRWRVEGQETVTVYPRVLPLGRLPLPLRDPFGQVETRRRILPDPGSLAGARPAQPGDATRWIHWKASARRGSLYTKQFDPTASGQAVLVVDTDRKSYEAAAAGEVSPDLLDAACELAAASGRLYLRRNVAVGAWVGGPSPLWIPPRTGENQMGFLLEALASASLADGGLEEALAGLGHRLAAQTALIVCSPHLEASTAAALQSLQQDGFGVLVVLVKPRAGGRAGGRAGEERPRGGPEAAGEVLRRLTEAGVHAYAAASVAELDAQLGGEADARAVLR
ncbi:MAG: DUF58 domain-containing protein [Bacillota bacterium]|nr:DUF58 domain-containing protein [Bacillota bacterium]